MSVRICLKRWLWWHNICAPCVCTHGWFIHACLHGCCSAHERELVARRRGQLQGQQNLSRTWCFLRLRRHFLLATCSLSSGFYTSVWCKPNCMRLSRALKAAQHNSNHTNTTIPQDDFDIGLATHLCGGATDVAQAVCIEKGAAFILTPCCASCHVTSRYHMARHLKPNRFARLAQSGSIVGGLLEGCWSVVGRVGLAVLGWHHLKPRRTFSLGHARRKFHLSLGGHSQKGSPACFRCIRLVRLWW
jgi:hypothetical protein